ncbi:bifunctional metallophosphatase/5'-nucleotidase [Aneurinibacillus terranovensis]|uniref:bifunctional metallophosphatase/5'-nucleotidase n=1 Tax=Aneurinibacillus terranovensis TaxID=278991 RepID=UPI000410661E|nr:bifunctional UDP-sugar hydrolase/5'-nucleotidase [Aneurinibacillus terranovensis]
MAKEFLHILHTNDLHSHLEEMKYITTGMRRLRNSLQRPNSHVVTADLGDHMDRMHLQTEATWGQVNIEVLNEAGYDLAAIGNNEGLTFPREKLDSLYNRANFKVLCANLRDQHTKKLLPGVHPCTIEKYGQITVGWIGVTAPFTHFYELMGLEATDVFQTVSSLVKQMRPHVDIVVLLSHVGYNHDIELASKVNGIDLILGAHTHTYLPVGEWVNGTLICQTGKFGDYFGHVQIEYDVEKKVINTMQAVCIPSKQFPEDNRIQEILTYYHRQSETIMQEVVAELNRDVPVSWEEESPLANLLAQGLRSWVDAEIALVNSGTLLFSLSKGPVTRKDMLSLCPHPINPCKMKITGQQLKTILEESLEPYITRRQIRGFGFRGKVLGRMSLDGLDVYYHPNRPTGEKIDKIIIGEQSIDERAIYTVATIDMFTFGIVFPTFTQGIDVEFYLPEFLRDVLEVELTKQRSLKKCTSQRWHPVI